MDKKTLAAYNLAPQVFCHDWLSQPTPQEIHDAVKEFFILGGPTADIGAGSGRDVHWLNENGFPCVGYDAATGLIAAARSKFPNYIFEYAMLPTLREIETNTYENVICETVIMHLPAHEHLTAVRNLLRILTGGGTLSLSWRHAIDNRRDHQGRLYEKVDEDAVIAFASSQAVALRQRTNFISSSSGKEITHLVFQKP